MITLNMTYYATTTAENYYSIAHLAGVLLRKHFNFIYLIVQNSVSIHQLNYTKGHNVLQKQNIRC